MRATFGLPFAVAAGAPLDAGAEDGAGGVVSVFSAKDRALQKRRRHSGSKALFEPRWDDRQFLFYATVWPNYGEVVYLALKGVRLVAYPSLGGP